MRRYSILLIFLLALSLLTGCASTDSILSDGQTDFVADLGEYAEAHGGEIPKSVLDTLDFMLENYTDGLEKPDIDDIIGTDISGDKTPDGDSGEVDYGDNITEAEAREKIVQALTNIDSTVAFKLDNNLFSHEYLYELVYGDICEEYMIESMRLKSYEYTYFPDSINNKMCVNLTFNYAYPKDQIKKMREETKAAAEKVVASLKLNDLSYYERVVAVNKYLCDTVTYSAGDSPYEPFQHTSYGALVKGDCVCEGYARAARILLSLCGVECLYVTGDTPEGGHAWNLVEIDGEYYQLDITWNDVDTSPNQYFLVTDDYMSLSRTWDKNKYPKSANKPYSN